MARRIFFLPAESRYTIRSLIMANSRGGGCQFIMK